MLAFELRSTETSFDVEETITAFKDGKQIFTRTTTGSVTRNLV